MEALLFDMPYPCDIRRCAGRWHKDIYWMYEDGTYGTCDQDGNHDGEPFGAEDLPTVAEQDAAWGRYYEYVAETGEDPLHEIYVSYGYKVVELWTFDIANSILGTVIRRWCRGRGPWHQGGRVSLPDHVLEFMLLDRPREGRLYRFTQYEDGPTTHEEWCALIRESPEVTWGVQRSALCHVRLPRTRPRKASAVQRDLKRIARRRGR
ncbi:hypothetical protein LCGC14_2741910 [marine sediment metagenome]|uniref:Uncharacterized protein n=1 Tax=marine sediment metagenome TaxID=412755 RepID=A0A0F8ZRF1_9ZZZZ